MGKIIDRLWSVVFRGPPQPVCEVNLIWCLSGKALMGTNLVKRSKTLSGFSDAVVERR